MPEQTNWSLLAKYLSGECSEKEAAEIKAWLESNPENQRIYNSYQTVWNIPEYDFEPSDVKALWEGVAQKVIALETEEIEVAKPRLTESKWYSIVYQFIEKPVLRYAAVFILAVSIPILYYVFSSRIENGELIKWKLVAVENKAQQSLTLDDGSKVVLDAGSQLQIPDNFDVNSRELKLEGEGYFEVAHDPDNPFIIYAAGNGVVQVLGTKFNVRAWEENDKVDIAVAEGIVSLGPEKDDTKSVILEKGFTASLSKDGELSEPVKIDIDKSLSWLKGEISFTNAQLSEILAQVERWYDLNITLTDSTIIKERLSVFVHKKSLRDVLDVITTLTDTKYKLAGNSVILMPIKNNLNQ